MPPSASPTKFFNLPNWVGKNFPFWESPKTSASPLPAARSIPQGRSCETYDRGSRHSSWPTAKPLRPEEKIENLFIRYFENICALITQNFWISHTECNLSRRFPQSHIPEKTRFRRALRILRRQFPSSME